MKGHVGNRRISGTHAALKDSDTRGTGYLARAGASRVHGVLEVTEFLSERGFQCKSYCYYRLIFFIQS